MKQYSYYSFKDNVHAFLMCNRQSDTSPIMVNCFGKFCQESDFFTSAIRSDYYLLTMIEGSLKLQISDKNMIMEKGDAIIIPPNTTYKYSSNKCNNVSYCWIHFTGYLVEEYLHSLCIQPLDIIHGVNIREILSCFEKMHLDTLNKVSFLTNELSLFACNILLKTVQSQQAKKTESQLIKSLAYINEHYDKDISIQTLAQIERLSVSRYNTVFRNLLGTSPVKYITELRMNKAKYLLDSTTLTVSQISDMCGYIDSHYFHKVFKNSFGVTPKKWRCSNR